MHFDWNMAKQFWGYRLSFSFSLPHGPYSIQALCLPHVTLLPDCGYEMVNHRTVIWTIIFRPVRKTLHTGTSKSKNTLSRIQTGKQGPEYTFLPGPTPTPCFYCTSEIEKINWNFFVKDIFSQLNWFQSFKICHLPQGSEDQSQYYSVLSRSSEQSVLVVSPAECTCWSSESSVPAPAST